MQWHYKWGAESPQRLLTGKFLLPYREKRGKEKRENRAKKKENLKREGGRKLKMEGGKVTKWGEDFLFLLTFKTTEIYFGSTKMGIFYLEKAFHIGKKIRKKMTLPPLKNIPLTPLFTCLIDCHSWGPNFVIFGSIFLFVCFSCR